MGLRLSPTWQNSMRQQITAFKSGESKLHISEVLTHPLPLKWLIAYLAEQQVSYQVIKLGGGVTRVTTQTDICKHCNGTGRC